MTDSDRMPSIRASLLEPFVLGAREDYQLSFTPRTVDSIVSVTLSEVTEQGEPSPAPKLDLSDLHESSAGGAWFVTFYPSASARGVYWILSTWTTALGMVHKRFARFTVV